MRCRRRRRCCVGTHTITAFYARLLFHKSDIHLVLLFWRIIAFVRMHIHSHKRHSVDISFALHEHSHSRLAFERLASVALPRSTCSFECLPRDTIREIRQLDTIVWSCWRWWRRRRPQMMICTAHTALTTHTRVMNAIQTICGTVNDAIYQFTI